jgi:sugar phosphate isomerase/epimerase
MRAAHPKEIGLMFWGEKHPEKTIAAVKQLGMTCGHLGFAGHVPLDGELLAQTAQAWKTAAETADFAVSTIFAAFEGESYADKPTVLRTVGFIPEATRQLREARSKQIIDVGGAMGVPSFACHVGFVPDDEKHPTFIAVRDLVRRLCDHAALYKMSFALETGQETAATMMHFLHCVERDNLKINFDPANMILYGTAEPIPALKQMGSQVVSVHFKDGNWPAKDQPDALGTEMPLGQGSVGMVNFVQALDEIGYQGAYVIEREVALDQDMDDRHKEGLSHHADILAAVQLLKDLRKN